MKKIFFTILLLAVTINSYAYDFSAVCSTGQTLYYKTTGTTKVKITFPGSNYKNNYSGFTKPTGRLEIPDVITHNGVNYSVTAVDEHAFRECSELTSIWIPNTVNTLGVMAFAGCGSLDTVYIGSNVSQINNACFNHTTINTLFYNCKELSRPTSGMISYVVAIGGGWAPSIPADSSASWNAYSYSYYYADPFKSTYNTTQKIILGDSVVIVPHDMFRWFSCINLFTCLANIKEVDSYAFYGRIWVNSGNLKFDSIISIGIHAFDGCSNLTSISFESDSVYISECAFDNCPNLVAFEFNNRVVIGNPSSNGNKHLSIEIGELVHVFTATLFCNSIIDTLRFNAYECMSMNSDVVFNGSILSNLYVGDGVRRFPDKAFKTFHSLQSISFSDSLRYIGVECFYNNDLIGPTIVFPSTTDSICNKAFYDCDNLSNINFNGRYIGNNAFAGSERLSTVVLGDNLESIGQYAFYNCDSLVTISTNSTNIGIYAFAECNGLSSVVLGNQVYNIGANSFFNCDNLLSITTNAHNIGRNAFADCDRLVSVTLGDSVRNLGNGAFNGCFRLQNINLGGTTTIGDSAFNGCVRLENPELPATLTTIGTRAFNGCSLLAGKLTFPATITSIGDYAYSGVGTITEIEMLGATPPTIYEHSFASVSSSTPVSVPCGAVLNYYTTDYWENFSTIVEAPPYNLMVSTNNETMGSASVSQQPTCSNHSAIIQATAETGFHFIQWSDGNGTNPRTVNMMQDSSFTAIFVPNNSQITVVPNDPLMGTTSGTGTYGYNAPVTMTATAYDGYHFLKWNDGNTQNPRYMAAVRDTTFTAIFVSNVSTITVGNANPDWGNVSGSGVYYYMNLVSLTATPVYGYHFSRWSDGNTQNPRTITVIQDSSFTAYFAVNTYSIVGTSNSTAMGSVTGGGTYTYLHEMSLTATPAFGYHFVQWNDQNTDNPRTITVTRDSAFTAQFAANSYTITAEPNDPTMGSAYGSGIFAFNTTATLTAVAEYGYHFTQWSDGVTDNPRTVTVQNSATYTAQFEINSYILTVQSSNPAIGTTSGGGSYNYLTPVNITAIPNDGYHFTQWSDGNTDNPRLVSVTANATYTAQFAINSYAVSVTCNNTSMGAVSGNGIYNHNSTATLTATAYYGYHFVQWQDGNTENPRTVVVTDSTQYTAQFDFNSYLITANSSNVTLGSAIGGGSYNYLSQVALTAVPVPHYHFTMWNDSIEDNPRTITVTRDSVFTAHFTIDRHTVAVVSDNSIMGSVSGSDTVDYNTAVWISATANYGYHFTQWNDGTTSNLRRVVVSQDTAFTASFAPNQYSATCAVNDNSRGTVASTGGSYSYLTSVTFTAIPNSDYHFLRWSNGSTDNPITFTLTQDTVLTAILVGLTANVNDNTMGTVSHSKPSNLVEVVTATPNYGYHFVQWNDGITDNPRTMNLVGDTSVTAIFAVNNYYVALGVNDEILGSVVGEGEYPYLSTVTITANAAEHSHFLQWSDGNTTNPRMLTVTSDTSLTAYFESDQQFQITVNANDTTRGSVEGSGNYYLGETAIITATANEHYYFAQWSDGMTSNPRVITVTGDMTYTAVFEPVMYTLTVAANDYLMGQVIGGGSYAYGTEVTIEARAFGGYRFLGWDDGVQEEQRTVTVTADASYTAMFEPNVGIDEVENVLEIYVQDGYIIVKGVENDRIQIYDLTGRKRRNDERLPAGVYMVRIDNKYTKKVVVL